MIRKFVYYLGVSSMFLCYVYVLQSIVMVLRSPSYGFSVTLHPIDPWTVVAVTVVSAVCVLYILADTLYAFRGGIGKPGFLGLYAVTRTKEGPQTVEIPSLPYSLQIPVQGGGQFTIELTDKPTEVWP